jgi:divalent metal cation (Fe/Co/Zn/Cd) transporter
MHAVADLNREKLLRRERSLERLTIGWNSLKGAVSIAAGAVAGSVSLVSFGLESFVEAASAGALLWRLGKDSEPLRREQAERAAVRFAGWGFFFLAFYVANDAACALATRKAPEKSLPGILMAVAALVAMPLLAWAKRRVAAGLGSAATRADARQPDFCVYLSAILAAGLLLNAVFGLWWADPAAALAMAALIGKEAIDTLRGRGCGCVDGGPIG